MNPLDYITSLFGSNDDATDALTTNALANLFNNREKTLNLTAEFHDPQPHMMDEPTAVFPYTLLTADGETYGTGTKEFPVPDGGFSEENSAVAVFLSELLDIDRAEVSVESLYEVPGTTADVSLDSFGDMVIKPNGLPRPNGTEGGDD